MFKSSKFKFIEWLILYFMVPFPFVNIVFIIFLVMRIGLLPTLKKLLILLGLYIVTFLIAFAFLSF